MTREARASAPLEAESEGASDRRIEVPAGRLLQDWGTAHARALAYLAALGVPEAARPELAARAVERALDDEAWHGDSGALEATLRAVRELVPLSPPWRAAGGLTSMPPIERGALVPNIEPHGLHGLIRRLLGRAPGRRPTRRVDERSGSERRRGYPWVRVAHRRRALLAVLVLIPSVIASGFMVNVLPRQGGTWLEFAIVVFFGTLFGWISIGFWTALLGFVALIVGRDRFAVTRLDGNDLDRDELPPGFRTAICMPIAAEPVDRVFAGLRAMRRSLERTGALGHFDFFVLSDTGDAATAVDEEEAWARWCREENGFGTIFYRRRQVRLERKSGNVADFCRRWGKRYRYMVTLDADSLMAGDTIVRLVKLMERHPDAGIIQTAPVAVNRSSLFARVQQFAGRVYGPMFAAGLHYWQLGDGPYWGHNTIIRVAPFMAHCGLPRIKGKPPLGGEILSHDFVEAALMGRAGWTVWLAYDLEGSYEEVPSTLLEEMKRDRRWCQGNLQHTRILFTEGLFGAHRALFVNGVLSYVSALLWLCFLSLSTAEALLNVLVQPDYFPSGPSLFPAWPIWRPDWALSLMAVTGMILFLPKILSVLLILFRTRSARGFGGAVKLWTSVLLEVLASSLLAPIRMVFHSRFVLTNLLGRTVGWRSSSRDEEETSWSDALRQHGLDTLLATIWGVGLYWLNPRYFWWVTPIIGALILSVPLSVLAARVSLGKRARRWGLFVIPEEITPPRELAEMDQELALARSLAAQRPTAERDGFVRATVDPLANALRRTLARGPRSLRASIRAARRALLRRALDAGPDALAARERRILLHDPEMVAELHARVWAIPDPQKAARWGRPGAPLRAE
ncbi:MAG TPA: glucans biosynthesis glucosyltransferase MdoH [Candidatus Bathyarchaeia archaeon]|nr:glucans biosynthesis glucosyltransferase MdoH [Candidatus Bathyarchaeia archaeon]